MKVLWKADLGQGKHDPLEVTHVVTKSGSQISAELVVPMDGEVMKVLGSSEEVDGLHEVIDAQMAEIDRLAKLVSDEDEPDPKVGELEGQVADAQDKLADLCVALGYAARPMMATGIAELDALLEVLR